jgi:hypothetical protein
MQPTTLARFTGTVIAIRTQKIDARPARVNAETGEILADAKPESSYDVIGLRVAGRYDGDVLDGAAIAEIIIGGEDPRPEPGHQLDCYAMPYVSWRPGVRGGRPFATVAYRFASLVGPKVSTTAATRAA